MGLFKIALICALALGASSAAVAEDNDLPHWNPGKKTIAKLDFAARNAAQWHGSPPKLDRFFRYYAGVTKNGKRMVRAEFTDFPNSFKLEKGDAKFYQDGPDVQITSVDKFPSISDGGCSVVNMLYDVDADRMVWLYCNGLA